MAVVTLVVSMAASAPAMAVAPPGPSHLTRSAALRQAKRSVDDEFFIDFSRGQGPLRFSGFHRYSARRVSFRFNARYKHIEGNGRTEVLPCFGRVNVITAYPPGGIEAEAASATVQGSTCGEL